MIPISPKIDKFYVYPFSIIKKNHKIYISFVENPQKESFFFHDKVRVCFGKEPCCIAFFAKTKKED